MRQSLRHFVTSLALRTSLGATQTVQNIPTLEPGDIVITGGQVFTGTTDTLIANTGIVVRRGILLEVGANLAGRDLSRSQVVRLDPAETILPGFFDLHAHYAIDLFGQDRVDGYTVNPIIPSRKRTSGGKVTCARGATLGIGSSDQSID